MENKEVKISGLTTTLGTDCNKMYAWAKQDVNGVPCIVLHERNEGMSSFSDSSFVTAIPIYQVKKYL